MFSLYESNQLEQMGGERYAVLFPLLFALTLAAYSAAGQLALLNPPTCALLM